MKIKDGFMLRGVAGKNVVVAVGAASLDFDGLISLNETGTFLWKVLEDGADFDILTEKLLAEYDIDEETAKRDISAFLEKVKEADLIIE